eukprot:comp68058_c0_seq1/m.48061 comp68058_c0_seq1/g.48061  ORF comp68058_c0_seq1/g.48061 comp68058_c0_seq1/m.48061 type:complete len:303 (-) comp68058_c0_seq1:411-1319(-)
MKRSFDTSSGTAPPKPDGANDASNPNKKKRKTSGKKKLPVTYVPMEKGWGKSGHQKIISEYHTIVKKIEATKADGELGKKEKEAIVKELEGELEEMGGLERYQRASQRGEKLHAGFNTATWVVDTLRELGMLKRSKEEGRKIRLLDIGALGENYAKEKAWIECTAIDINSQHPFVKEIDFFEFPLKETRFDVVSLSLVVNFVGDVRKRGEMIKRAREHLTEGGFMFLILPLPCVVNSRYMNEELLLKIATHVGYKLVKSKQSKKLAFYCFSKVEETGDSTGIAFPKRVVNKGPDRNNFTIVL